MNVLIKKHKCLEFIYGKPKSYLNDVWAISDIHGCYLTFKKLLSKINYSKLYVLGDHINRGPRSKEVVDFIMEHRNVIPLKGNHEQALLEALKDKQGVKIFLKKGGDATLESFGVSSVHDIPSEYLKWFKNLRTYVELRDYYLVHININFGHPVFFDRSDENYAEPLWMRHEYPSNFGNQAIPHKRIVSGHVPHDLEFIKKSANSSAVYIDGGCARGGYLVAFNLGTNEIITQKKID